LSQITASITSPFKTHTLLKKTISLLSQATAEHSLYLECLLTLLTDITTEPNTSPNYLDFIKKILSASLLSLTDKHFGDFPITHSSLKKQIETINAFIEFTHTNNFEEQHFFSSLDPQARNEVIKTNREAEKKFLLENLSLFSSLTSNLLQLSHCHPDNYSIDKIVHSLYPLQSPILVGYYLYFLSRAVYKGDIQWVTSVFSKLFVSSFFMEGRLCITEDLSETNDEIPNFSDVPCFSNINTDGLLRNLCRALDTVSENKLYGELMVKIGGHYKPSYNTITDKIARSSYGTNKFASKDNRLFIRDAIEVYFNRKISIEVLYSKEFSIEKVDISTMIYKW
ncbi:hypothetical protein CDIK_4422, partial [Cucumispora dikerogammari]